MRSQGTTPGVQPVREFMLRADSRRGGGNCIASSRRTNRREMKKVLHGIPLPVFTIDSKHAVTTWNRACERITGIPEREILGRSDAWKAFYPRKRPVLADLLADAATEEEVAEHYGYRYKRSEIFPDIYMTEDFFPALGENGIWLFFSASPLRDEDGSITGAIEILTDITRCKEAEKASRENEAKYRQLFEQSAVGIILADSEHKFLDVNPMALEILGYSREEMTGMHAEDLIHPDDRRSLPPETNLQRLAAGETFRVERRYRKSDGDYIPVEVSLRRFVGEGPVDHMVMFHDIVQRKQAEEKVHYLAYYDQLTDLPNRTLFHDRLKKAIDRSERTGCGGAVLLVDIERLKSVNDTLGQRTGDEYVAEIGRRIMNTLRGEDTVARVSGGEFLVLAEEIDCGTSVHALSRRVLERISEPLDLAGRVIYPQANIGFTFLPHTPPDPDTLIKQTDMAMSEAKKSGARIKGFVEQDDWISREFHLEHDLKRALETEEFRVYYQPQIALGTGRIAGIEALIRWENPERGLVSPGEFIPVLERTGMIASVDEWVVRRVCEQLRLWREKGVHVKASVNISAQELNNDSILREIGEALEKTRLPSECLEVELTETDIMRNIEQASEVLRKLADWGVRVALDDFGKGYSSMSHLQKLPIRIIKIDREFVRELPDSRDAVTLIQTMIAMGHNLGKEVLAEGVEHEEQARVLHQLGCDYGQGFLWGRPQPAQDLTWE